MNALAARQEFECAADPADEALSMLNTPISAALPAPAQFAAVTDLIKSVFHVPSVAVALHAAAQGVHILRVHDTGETRQALDLWQALAGQNEA